jgi:hypothetical protein
MLARELANPVRGYRRAVGVGLVVEACERVDQIEVVALDRLDEVARAVAIGNHPGEHRFVVSRIVERDRAGVDRLLGQASHRRDDRARIDTAGKKGAQRHFGDQAQLHRFAQPLRQLRTGIFGADAIGQRETDVPVFARRGHGVAAPHTQRMTRRQLARLAEDAAWLGDVAEREVLLDRERVDVAPQAAVREQRLELKEQGLAVAVPQHEREHAAESRHAVLAPSLPSVDDDLGVAARTEHMAEREQLRNERLVVVDLAVENHRDRSVFVEQRLLPGRHIDDRQAAVAKAQSRLDVHAALVRAAVMLRLVHALQLREIDRSRAAGVEDAGDAAHGVS